MPAVTGLDEEVKVIGLNAEVDDPKETLPCGANLPTDAREQRLLPQTR